MRITSRHGHADGKPVVDHEFKDQERTLPVEDLEQLRHFLLEREAVIGPACIRSVVLSEHDLPHHSGRWIEHRLAVPNFEPFEPPVVNFLHDLDEASPGRS